MNPFSGYGNAPPQQPGYSYTQPQQQQGLRFSINTTPLPAELETLASVFDVATTFYSQTIAAPATAYKASMLETVLQILQHMTTVKTNGLTLMAMHDSGYTQTRMPILPFKTQLEIKIQSGMNIYDRLKDLKDKYLTIINARLMQHGHYITETTVFTAGPAFDSSEQLRLVQLVEQLINTLDTYTAQERVLNDRLLMTQAQIGIHSALVEKYTTRQRVNGRALIQQFNTAINPEDTATVKEHLLSLHRGLQNTYNEFNGIFDAIRNPPSVQAQGQQRAGNGGILRGNASDLYG